MIPTTIAIGYKYTFFLPDRCEYLGNDRIEKGSLLKNTAKSLDPFDFMF